MKKIIPFLFFLFALQGVEAQSPDSWVKEIRSHYNTIRQDLHTYDTTMIEIWDESTEGGQATAFYEGSNLKLIEVVWLGETVKHSIGYYFDNDQLIFAFDQHFKYNRPIYWDKKKAAEMGDDEVFDYEKTTITEERYYFKEEQLFRWLDNDKKEVDLSTDTNTFAGQGLITHCHQMKDQLKK